MVPWLPRTGLRNLVFGVKRVIYPRTARHERTPLLHTVKYILLGLLLFLIVHATIAPSYTHPPAHYGQLAARCNHGKYSDAGCANEHNETVFISITLYDPVGKLIGGEWGDMLLELIHLLGPENVFLSMYENDVSQQGTEAWENFRQRLGPCRNSLVSDTSVSLEGFPKVRMPDGTEVIKRIAYLAELRNRALRPLETFSEEELGTSRFDKVLFINDVFFQPIDAAQLLFNTNRGDGQQPNYLAACALDYEDDPLTMYDSYVLRDADGYSTGEQIFPYFTNAGRGLSRSAILRETDAVPVKACWNGLIAMQAEYVQNGSTSLPQPTEGRVINYTIDPDAPRNVTIPIRFRAEPDPFLDASECCLFVADLGQAATTAGAEELGVYLNPYVRVAYYAGVMRTLPWAKPWERLLFWPHWLLTTVKSLPTPNPSRTVEQGQQFIEEVWRQESGEPSHWEMVDRMGRSGLFCGIRGMQVLSSEARSGTVNWRDTDVPAGASSEASVPLYLRPWRASLKRLHSVMPQANTIQR